MQSLQDAADFLGLLLVVAAITFVACGFIIVCGNALVGGGEDA